MILETDTFGMLKMIIQSTVR